MPSIDGKSIYPNIDNVLDVTTLNYIDIIKTRNKQILNVKINDIHSIWRVCIIGGFFCMISGYINAVSYESFDTSATHISGTTTQCGIELAHTNMLEFLKKMILIISFIFGSMISSLCLGGSRTFKGGVRYVYILYLISILLSTSIIVYNYQYFFVSSLFLTLISGILNALTTTYSGAVVRVTHVTGTATDIGIELGKICGHGDYSGLWRLKLFLAFLSSVRAKLI